MPHPRTGQALLPPPFPPAAPSPPGPPTPPGPPENPAASAWIAPPAAIVSELARKNTTPPVAPSHGCAVKVPPAGIVTFA